GSVWVVTAGPTLSHVDDGGEVVARRAMTGVDRGAYVKQIGSMLVVGGRASHLLTAPDPKVPAPASDDPAVTAFDAVSHEVRWQWGRGVTAHVLGEENGVLVVEVARGENLSLVALDFAGHQRWSTDLPTRTTADMTLRDGTVIVRTASAVAGYDARTGARRWTRVLGAAFPVGFDLGAQPSVGERVLLGTTTALVALDPATGRAVSYPLPTAGSVGAFWPYEITVSGRSAIVETNTGAVLIALRPRL
ncbi:MAG: outer membrane protein assembly factor BamB family protein, partial [Marmoricola sp.]